MKKIKKYLTNPKIQLLIINIIWLTETIIPAIGSGAGTSGGNLLGNYQGNRSPAPPKSPPKGLLLPTSGKSSNINHFGKGTLKE